MADIGGLQLLEDRKKIEVSVPGQNRLLVFAIIFIIAVASAYFIAAAYKQRLLSSLAVIDNQLADLEKSRDKQLEKSLLELHEQLSVVNPLVSAHFFWSSALALIQSVIQPQVQFQSINADAFNKKIVVSMIAANYTTIARQIAAFYTLDSVTDVILSRIQSQSTGRLETGMQIFFDPDKLLAKK